MGSEGRRVDPVVSELDRALRGIPDPVTEGCLAGDGLGDVLVRVAALQESVARIDSLLDEFMPLLRAYLDPNQAGPRGAFLRRRLRQAEADG